MAEARGPIIRLQDGPGAGQQYYEDDFLERSARPSEWAGPSRTRPAGRWGRRGRGKASSGPGKARTATPDRCRSDADDVLVSNESRQIAGIEMVSGQVVQPDRELRVGQLLKAIDDGGLLHASHASSSTSDVFGVPARGDVGAARP